MTSDNERALKCYFIIGHGLYFRPEARGYTGIRDEAGLFTKEYAEKYCDGSHGELSMLHKDDVKAPEFMPAAYSDLIIAHLKKQRDTALQRDDSVVEEMDTIKDDVQHALKYVKAIISGLETEPEHVKKAIACEETRIKALYKIENKMNIFETLEILCEYYISKFNASRGNVK